MLEVTTAATEQIAAYFRGKDVSPIRIFLNEGGWGGPGLAMALDEPRDNDEVIEIDGFKYLINREFLERAKPIRVDFMVHGFKLDCGIDFSSGCSACGTTSSCCSTT